KCGKKLHLHRRSAAQKEITCGSHQIVSSKRPRELASKRIAGAGGQDHVPSSQLARSRLKVPLSRSACDAGHAALYDLSSRLPGAIQQESLQHAAGTNSAWLSRLN